MAKAKKAAAGAGSIRLRSDGRWEGRITVGHDPLNGKQITRSVYAATQAECRQKLTQIASDLDCHQYVPPTRYTVGQWLDVYLAEYAADLKFSTIATYRAMIENHLKPLVGGIKLTDFTPVQAQMFINRLSKPEKGKKPLAPKSVQLAQRILSRAMNVAVRQGLLKSNPVTHSTLPKTPKTEVNPLADKQIRDFLKLCDSADVYSRIFKVLLFTGMRISECLGLTWDDVDFQRNTLKISKQLVYRKPENGGYVYTDTKSGKPRLLTVPPFVIDVLREQKEAQILERFAAGEAWQGWQSAKEAETAPVFTREDGSFVNRGTVYFVYKRRIAQIAPESTVHDLRHTYACLALQNEDSVKTVQLALGHSTAAFTLDIYGHVSEKMRQESANRMQRYIQSAIG